MAAPVFISLVLVLLSVQSLRDRQYHNILLVLAVVVMFSNQEPGRVYHIPSFESYNPELVEAVSSLDSELILFEECSHIDKGQLHPCPYPHLLFLLQEHTGKRFLGHISDGWHHTPYRNNSLNSGLYLGRQIGEYEIETLNGYFKKWGIRHLLLWTPSSKEYFMGEVGYRLLWNDSRWAILEYEGGDLGDVLIESGSGEVVERSFFHKKIRLENVQEGETVTLRTNYFQAWKGYHGDEQVELNECRRLQCFTAPASGSYDVVLKYPRHAWTMVLAVLALVIAFYYTRRDPEWRLGG
jgi:hypothetical protein